MFQVKTVLQRPPSFDLPHKTHFATRTPRLPTTGARPRRSNPYLSFPTTFRYDENPTKSPFGMPIRRDMRHEALLGGAFASEEGVQHHDHDGGELRAVIGDEVVLEPIAVEVEETLVSDA